MAPVRLLGLLAVAVGAVSAKKASHRVADPDEEPYCGVKPGTKCLGRGRVKRCWADPGCGPHPISGVADSFRLKAEADLSPVSRCAPLGTDDDDGRETGWQTGASMSLLNLGGVMRARSPREPRTNARGPQTFARTRKRRDDL